MIIIKIGEKIKKLREEKGITQEEIAKAINSTKQTIYKYETGIITNIPSDKIESISKILNCSPAYLMGWENKKEIDKSFGKKLQTIRKMKNYTQQQLSDLLGLNKTILSSWEIGKSEPNIKNIKDLCNILEISVNELFDFRQETHYMTQQHKEPEKKSLKKILEEEDKKQYAKIAGYGGGVKTIEINAKEEYYYALIKNDIDGYKKIDMTKEEFIKIRDMLDILRK